MAQYALVRPDNSIDRIATNVDPRVLTRSGYRWMSCPAVAQPEFDSTTEKVIGPTYSVGQDSVTQEWQVVALTAQELSEAKDSAISAINGGGFAPIIRALFNLNNRVRVLEGAQPMTLAQFKTLIKSLL